MKSIRTVALVLREKRKNRALRSPFANGLEWYMHFRFSRHCFRKRKRRWPKFVILQSAMSEDLYKKEERK